MVRHILWTVHGALSAWGGPAPGTIRPTANHPTKSAIVGMVAAAMGVDHDHRERLLYLEQRLGYAVRTDHAGVRIRDHHTAQSAPQKLGVHHRSRKSELERDPAVLYTIISSRDYLCDAHWTVCLWPKQRDEADDDLERIRASLCEPVFTPYLGRKSCPFSLPMAPQVIASKTLKEAFSDYTLPMSPGIEANAPVAVHWEGDHPDPGFLAEGTTARRDALANPVSRAFHLRHEHVTTREIPLLRVEGDGCI